MQAALSPRGLDPAAQVRPALQCSEYRVKGLEIRRRV